MKFNILLKPSDTTLAYRPGDQVSGTLRIENHVFKEPPTITAIFRGTYYIYRNFNPTAAILSGLT